MRRATGRLAWAVPIPVDVSVNDKPTAHLGTPSLVTPTLPALAALTKLPSAARVAPSAAPLVNFVKEPRHAVTLVKSDAVKDAATLVKLAVVVSAAVEELRAIMESASLPTTDTLRPHLLLQVVPLQRA